MTDEANRSKTLDRGLQVLWALADHADGLSVTEIATELSIHRTAVYRLLATLSDHRLVVRMGDGRYRLGGAVVALARGAFRRLQDAALPELTKLAGDVGATAYVTVLDGDDAVAIAVIEPPRSGIHVAYRVGFRHQIEVGAPGMAILSGNPPRPDERPEIAVARQRGYCATSGEIQPGAFGIAAPIRTPGKLVEASVGVVSMQRLDEDTVPARVVAAADAVAQAG